MKMQFSHAGRQFFFITIATEGRSPVLSRLVDEKSRPALLPCGEAVKATLVAMHGAFSCVTVSDFVIMPDHVHFVMIVDYSRDPGFSPLWAAHRMMDAAEELGFAGERTGSCAPRTLGKMPTTLRDAAELSCAPRTLGEMPTTLRDAAERSCAPKTLGEMPTILRDAAAEALAAAVSAARRNQGHLIVGNGAVLPGRDGGCTPETLSSPRRGFGGSAPVPSPAQGAALRWDRRCYIALSFDARQLAAIRRYIRLNPARALWKLLHPDRFVRFANIRHAVLDPARRWDAMGNLTLLGSPFLRHVRLTMKLTAEEHGATIDEIVAAAERGVVPVCGFISAGEKELLSRLKATRRARFIKTVPLPCRLATTPLPKTRANWRPTDSSFSAASRKAQPIPATTSAPAATS